MKHIRKFEEELNEGLFGLSKKEREDFEEFDMKNKKRNALSDDDEMEDDVEGDLTHDEIKNLHKDIVNTGPFGPGKKFHDAAAKIAHNADVKNRRRWTASKKEIGKDDVRFGEEDPDNPSVEILLQRCVKLKDKFPDRKDYYRGKIAAYRHVLDMKADGELYFDKKSY